MDQRKNWEWVPRTLANKHFDAFREDARDVINKTTPGNSSGSGSKGTTDFGGSSRNSGSDMNKDKDMNKPGRAGFEASNRDPNLDRSSSKQTDSEVSGGGSPKNSPSSGTGRNH